MFGRFIDPLFRLFDKVTQLSATQRAGLMAHLLIPGLFFAIAIFFGGGLIFGLEKGVAISELKTEIDGNGAASNKRGIVVIAETSSSRPNYLIPLLNPGSTMWNSLDKPNNESNAPTIHGTGRLVMTTRGLYVANELINDLNQPVAIVFEGELGEYVEIPGSGKEPVSELRLASRRSVYLIVGILISCSLALGIGAVLGVPAVNSNENNARDVGTEPDEN